MSYSYYADTETRYFILGAALLLVAVVYRWLNGVVYSKKLSSWQLLGTVVFVAGMIATTYFFFVLWAEKGEPLHALLTLRSICFYGYLFCQLLLPYNIIRGWIQRRQLQKEK